LKFNPLADHLQVDQESEIIEALLERMALHLSRQGGQLEKRSLYSIVVLSSILLLAGLIVLSPSAGFLLMVLAALVAAIPSFLGRGTLRIVGIILLFLSIAFSVVTYPPFRNEQQVFLRRGK